MNLLKVFFSNSENRDYDLHTLLACRSVSSACLGYFMAALAWVIFFNVGDGISIPALVFKLFFVFVAEITAGYCIASFAGLFLDFKNETVPPAELFILIGSAGWIKSLLIAGALISAMCPQAHLFLIAPLFLLIVFILQLVYMTKVVTRCYNVSTSRTIVAWIFGVIPGSVVFALVGVFFVWGILLLV